MRKTLSFVFISFCLHTSAQPFIDVLQANSQWLTAKYRNYDATHVTRNHFLNVFLPKKIKHDRVLFVRLNAEMLHSEYKSDSLNYEGKLYQIALPLGMQFPLNKKGLSLTTMILPRISSSLQDRISSSNDLQLGAVALLAWKKSEKFRLRAGLFYNYECFGNFFVPLIGVDWKLSEKFQVYGLLPQYYRAEYKLSKRFYTGLGMRFYGRSYRLGRDRNNNYVWNQENQVKLFLDYYPAEKLVFYAEIARSLGYGPYEVLRSDKKSRPAFNNPLYSGLHDSWFLNFGFAYRVRN